MFWCRFKVYLKLNKSDRLCLYSSFRLLFGMVSKDASHIACSQTAVLFSKYLLKLQFQRLSIFISSLPWQHLSLNAFIQCAGGTKTSKCCQCLSTFEYTVDGIFWVDFVVWWSHRLIISEGDKTVSLEYTHMYTQIQMSSQKLPKHTCALSNLKSFSFASHIYSFPSKQAMCKQDLEVYCIL